MKVLVICSHYPPCRSPESNHALLLCEQLSARGFDVHLLTSTASRDTPPPSAFHLHATVKSWGWRGAFELGRILRRVRPDVVYLIYLGWIYAHHPMITFAPTLVRLLEPKTPTVVQFENTLGASLRGRHTRAIWRLAAAVSRAPQIEPRFGTLLAHSTAIVALCAQHAAELIRACPGSAAKIHTIPAPPLIRMRSPDAGEARHQGRRQLGIPGGDPTVVICYFGYVYAGKGLETLLAAASLFSVRRAQDPTIPRCQWIVVGRVVDDALAAELDVRARHLHPDDHFVWLGHREHEAASTLLWASDIAVLPFDEGVRLNNSSVAVCAHHGLPIVSTRGSTLEPPFEHGRNILLCPPQAPQELADAVLGLVQSAARRQALGCGATVLAETVFSWTHAMGKTAAVLDSVLPSGARRTKAPVGRAAHQCTRNGRAPLSSAAEHEPDPAASRPIS